MTAIATEALVLQFISPDSPLYEGELELRFRVLREPLGRPRDSVPFPFERESLHLVAVNPSGEVKGCALFHPESEARGRLFQMAVHPTLQGQGLGRRLVVALEEEVRRRGFREVHLHAREHVVPFYEKLGYAVTGERFLEVGIPHREMRRFLRSGEEPTL